MEASAPSPATATAPTTQYYDVNFDWIQVKPLRTSVKKVYPYVCKVLGGMEWIGGKVAYGLGLTQSRFQYAVDEHYKRERRKQKREMEEAALMLQRAREKGLLNEDDDVPYAPKLVTRVAAPLAVGADLDAPLLTSLPHTDSTTS